MAKRGSTVALTADPADTEDFDVSHEGVERALAERRARAIEQVTLRLERHVLDRFRAAGPDWEARINEALRRAAP